MKKSSTEKFIDRHSTYSKDTTEGPEEKILFCPLCGGDYTIQKGTSSPPTKGFLCSMKVEDLRILLDGLKSVIFSCSMLQKAISTYSDGTNTELYRKLALTKKAYINHTRDVLKQLKSKEE